VEIFSACPFAVSMLPWEPAPGRHSVSVCVKATFVLAPGAATIAPLQEAVGADRSEGGLAGAGDLVPFKPRAEVLLVGHAYAPGGAPIDALIARARVGPFRKSLSITGDRTWVPSFDGLRPSVAVPFRRMPLRYDLAVRTGENLGGVDIISQGAELGRALANIAAIADQGGETPGFGPLPLGWRAHRSGLGDDALAWASRVALAEGPPPAGFDFHVFNAAPSEQQLDEIPPGVEIVLESLSPEHPRLETRLPKIRVALFRRAAPGERAAELPVRCDTLWIDTDRALAFAIWRGAVPLSGPEEAAAGTLVVVATGEDDRIGARDVDRLLDRLDATVATYIDATAAFAAAHAADAPAEPAPESAPEEVGEEVLGPASSAPAPPAAAAQPAEPEDEPTPPPEEGRGSRTTLAPPAMDPGAVEALPFRPPPALPFGWAQPAPEPLADADVVDADDDAEATPPRGYPAVALLLAPPPADLAPAPEARRPSTSPPPPLAPPPHAPFPSGPFGTMRPDPPTAPPPAAAPVHARGLRPAEPGSAPEPPVIPAAAPEPSLPLAMDVYCAIKAEGFRTGAKVRDVLGKHGVDEAVFRAHEEQQAARIEAEAMEGRADRAIALLDALRAARS
jgi:hypothetical protein